LQILLYEFKTDLNKYLAERRSPYKTLADLIKFNEENKDARCRFSDRTFSAIAKQRRFDRKGIRGRIEKVKRASREAGIDAVVAKNNLDAIVSPAVGGTWSLAAVAGYPYITVPAGFVDNLPVGIAFFGRAFAEPQLIKIAYAFEQKTRLRQAPKFLPSSE
jgi:amidase